MDAEQLAPSEITHQTIDTFLAGFGRFGVNLGLARMQRLLARLGNPETRVPIVHVAGTNGKGSVCAYVSTVLSTAGYRVGRYTSPHLLNWCERICINQQPIAEAQLWHHLQTVTAAIPDDETEPPTQFEVFTAAAWSYFAAAAVDIAVIEVGLGGRLDATNVCAAPLVTAVVSLGRDHWQRLGPTLADIAREKAGIIKPGRPVVVGPLSPEADTVVRQRASALESPLYAVTPASDTPAGQWQAGLGDYQISYQAGLLGDHQRVNSGVAIAILQLLQQQGWMISSEAIQTGLARTQWPGRLQWITWRHQHLLLDGAHNAAAAQELRRYVDQLPQPVTWLMGMLVTKDHTAILQTLLRPGDSLCLVPVSGHQTATPATLAELAQALCPQLAQIHTHITLDDGLEQLSASSNSTKVFCGSLYLIGEFLAQRSQTS